MKPILLLDMDSTLVHYASALERDYKSLATPDEDLSLLWKEDAPPYVKERKKLICSQPNWWFNLEPIEKGMLLYHKAKEIGFAIHILTKGPFLSPNGWTEKVLWVRKHLDNDVKINIVEEKSLFYGKVLIDDYPPYIEPWLAVRKNGLVIMPLYDYNAHIEHPNVIKWTGENMSEIETALTKAYHR